MTPSIVQEATATESHWSVGDRVTITPQTGTTTAVTARVGAIIDSHALEAPVILPEKTGLVIPVAGVKAEQLTDNFSDARGGGSRLHEALDIMAPRGTPVVAAAAGTVEKLFHSDAGGNTIYVRTPDRKAIHYYAHLDRYVDGLREGQSVTQGQTLGAVGSTGDASPDAPHLHFEIMQTKPNAKWYEPATSIDPYPLLTGKQP